MQNFDVIVIGQGYAGLKAAKLAAERGLRTATTEKMFPGGLVMSVNELHPAPEGEEPSGPELTGDLAMSNMDSGVENIQGGTNGLSRAANGDWQVSTDDGDYSAPNIIIASGARLRKLGVPGEEEFQGMGVSECADCDGPLYHEKEAVVIGGGNSAFQEAVALTAYSSKVTIIMRGAASRADAHWIDAVAANPKITVVANTQVTEIVGDGSGVTGVRLDTPLDGADILPCSVIFVFVGLVPDTDFLPADVERDENGAVVTNANLQSSQSGLWAIGAARSSFGGTLQDASDDAARIVAAL